MRPLCRNPLPLALLVTFIVSEAAAAAVPPQKSHGASMTFASQGQAAYKPEDPSSAQQEALHAFLTNGVQQAMDSLTNSLPVKSGLEGQRDRLLGQAERYVQSYRITTEGRSKGVYTVVGMVSVSMDSLRRELIDSLNSPSRGPLPLTGGNRLNEANSSAPPSLAGTGEAPHQQSALNRGIVLSKPAIYWAVPEMWGDRWVMPSAGESQGSPFARNMLQEAEDFNWTLAFPAPNGLSPDLAGNLPVDRVKQLARQAGARHAVIGTVAKATGEVSLPSLIEVDLRMIDVLTGRSLGDVHKACPLDSDSIQDVIMRLADPVASQLDRALQSGTPSQIEPKLASERSIPVSTPDGIWTLRIRGENNFAYWESLEGTLRDRYPGIQVRGLILGEDFTQAVVEGISGEFVTSIGAVPLPKEAQVSLENLSPEARQAELSVHRRAKAETPSTEPLQ